MDIHQIQRDTYNPFDQIHQSTYHVASPPPASLQSDPCFSSTTLSPLSYPDGATPQLSDICNLLRRRLTESLDVSVSCLLSLSHLEIYEISAVVVG